MSTTPLLHVKFQDHRAFGSGKDFKGFYHIWALILSWSSDMDYLHKLSFSLPIYDSQEIWLD